MLNAPSLAGLIFYVLNPDSPALLPFLLLLFETQILSLPNKQWAKLTTPA